MSQVDVLGYFKQQKVVAHCFSPDGKYIAVSVKNKNEVEIFDISSVEIQNINSWKSVWALKDSSMPVAAVDWSVDNKILTCSYDKSIYVYRLNDKNKWIKDLVLVANDRAVLDGVWSPNGQKFAVGTGCHRVFVGYYQEANNWWQSDKISNNKSSIIQVRWHPSGRVIGVASSDFTISLISAVIVDTTQVKDPLEMTTYQGPFDKVNNFGEGTNFYQLDIKKVFFTVRNTNGWVDAINFSPGGTRFAIAVHTGQLQYFNLLEVNDITQSVEQESEEKSIYPNALPFTNLLFIDEDTVIATGHDRKPALLTINNGWKWNGFLEKSLGDKTKGKAGGVKNLSSAFETKGVKAEDKGDKSSHLTSITSLRQLPTKEVILSTSDVNGVFNFWTLQQ